MFMTIVGILILLGLIATAIKLILNKGEID